jgi:hypothetical protein
VPAAADGACDVKNTTALILIAVLLLFGLTNRSTPLPTPVPVPVVVDDAPFPSEGLTVVVIEETETRMRGELSPGHFAALTSLTVRDWAKEAGAHFRVFDQHTPTAGMTETEAVAFKLKADSLPWIHISNGKTGFTGPLPDGVEATIALMGKYK